MDTVIDYVTLEETINNLSAEPAIREKREALVNFVKIHLGEASLSRWREKGITQDMEDAFLDKGKSADKDMKKELLERFRAAAEESGISQRRFNVILKMDRKSALEDLKSELLEKELILFRKENNLSAKVWLSFLNCTVLPGKSTLEKIKNGLNLNDNEAKEFDSLVIQNVFYVNKKLCECVRDYLNMMGMNATEFSNYACIGRDAWSAFSCSNDSEDVKKTSQGTLLKMTIGFGLDEDKAWKFMDTAGSTFVVRRDLVFLACIHCQYHNPENVDVILDHFNTDYYGHPIYENPYTRYWA